ncbi:MAG: hypothetical protein E6I87_13150 [Chloroflexi bacterium]|nr:MAG: hypothetical protein E6I87_13150 [Chloroflexota bacterium]
MKNVEVSNLAPQRPRFLREFAESPDYILEPAWRGTRALVEVGPRPTAVGYDRKPVAVPRELLDAIVAVIAADEAVVDGVFVEGFVDESDLEPGEGDDAFVRRTAPREVFVAIDLLELDGVSLLEVPLLERKRHLAAIMRPSQNVRLTPYVRRGFRAWRDTLEGQGFKQFVVKKVNSRYRPGETTDDWLQIEKL